MNVWSLSDLHLSISTPSKDMAVFGAVWEGYMAKIEANWKKLVEQEDLVLIAGDTSWAMKLEDALIDLKWIDNLPGTKVLIKGNHDYWWNSVTKIREALPKSLHIIQNDVFDFQDYSIGGTRL